MRVWIAVWTGSSRLSTAVAGWLLGGGGAGIFGRLLLVLAAAGFVKGLPWTTRIVVGVALVWLVTAVLVGLRLPDPTAPRQAAEVPTGTGQAAAVPPGAVAREQLVQALHTVGAPHAHTSALAEHLGTSTDAVRAALAAARIPLSGGVRMKGRPVAVSPGVKSSDFPPLPSPGQEAAGEGPLTSNNNDNNAAFESVPDAVQPWRTLVRWRHATK